MTPEIIDTPEGPPDLPRIGTRQSNTLHAYFSYSSSTPSATKKAPKKRPSRVTKKMVSYCNTSDSELEFDEDGYERFKTKSFKKKANATNSDSNEFELGPEADTVLLEIESENEDPIAVVFDEKDATKPSTAAKSPDVSKSLTDKEKRATNKKIKEEVLPKKSTV